LTKKELEEIIDAKTGHKFDDEVFDDLYKNMRKEMNGQTSLEDFTNVWLEADNRLRSKIDYCDRLVDEYSG
jgi:Ca2+-binding EF-hand superfamily protein